MIREVYDKKSGAILFKRDKESMDIEYLLQKINDLESKNASLERKMKKLEKSQKENS